jgi:UDP-glucose 4-epimerase
VSRILLTGAAGFIGRHVIDRLARNHEVIPVGFESTQVPGSESLRWLRWDIRAPAAPGQLPGFDAVVHLAQARDYRRFPELAGDIARVNVDGLINVLEAARLANAARVVIASSGGVYAAGPGLRTESDAPSPGNFYQATKLSGEILSSAYGGFFGIVCLRLFFPYGTGQPPSRFLPDLVRRVISGEPVQLHGSEGLRANPVHVDDAAVAFERALELDGSHVINVAGPDVLTLRQMVQMIGDTVGRAPVFEEAPERSGQDLVADITLMKRRLGAPQARFSERIADVCQEVRSTLAR